MKRTLATTALAVSALFCLPALAQQSPSRTEPNPSNPPIEGPAANRGTSAGVPGNLTNRADGSSQTTSKPKNTGDRAKKPRQQSAAPYSTADAPSGPKGDSPDPAPKN
ncbi:hypothetical protein [Cupriavidus pampae]|uniref:Translation initiation factor IF-2 n=1 Tax=Cupriavidus pampae TaxID=659251 RepID=A0ABM8XWG2_9BURK|nr:hypothetical protein [Cupriavidus pampae]CAG9184749.1 hypothetical protein LMG32289_05724 [Cupriavidus pampae]